ncbi:MAG TPA: carboxylate--amine ligase, partial [Alphaproteobacteria bacterium]|nr:carboxylate--amine ligase [Alphaproteobacteria bacterium]
KLLTEKENIKLSTTACHPFFSYKETVTYPSERYDELIDRNQWLSRRTNVYGLHVHIGMKNGEECINFINFFLRFIPHLLALSASSPFWQGDDTGLASCRPTTYEALPTAGLPYRFNSWNEFENLYRTLKACGSIKIMNDLWWDIRPSPKYGTLEIRSCDGVATLSETLGIVSFIHLLAHWFNDNSDWLHSVSQPAPWILRENKWRAMRHGLNAEIVTTSSGETKSIKTDILDWLNKLEPYSKKLHYNGYVDQLREVIEKGNSADRQRKVYEKTSSLKEVVKSNIAEFENLKPIFN